MNRKLWKIKNISTRQIKVAVATSSHSAPGVILQAGQFCLSIAQMTAPIDVQTKRGFVEVFKEFDNSLLNLEMAKAYDERILMAEEKPLAEPEKTETILEKITEEVEQYQKETLTEKSLDNIMW